MVKFHLSVTALTMLALGAGALPSVAPSSALASYPGDCDPLCECELKVTVLSATLPPCVDFIDLTLGDPANGCCPWEGNCTPANCTAKVTIEMQGADGYNCRKRIEGPTGAAQGTGDLSYEDEFNKECQGSSTYTLYTGNPSVAFASYKVECQDCEIN